MSILPRLFGLICSLTVSAVAVEAHALPDMWRPDASYYNYQYKLDTSADPYNRPYNHRLNYPSPQTLPANHDTSYDFYLFEPRLLNGAKPGPRPLVVYFHGAAVAPKAIDVKAQIEHYVRSGYTVLWMPFCDTQRLCVDFVNYTGNAASALLDARFELGKPGHVGLAHDASGRDQVVFVAHSLGAHVAATVAGWMAVLNQGLNSLPVPRALIFQDAAGHAATVRNALEAVNLGFLYQAAINLIEENGWGWDDPDGGPRTYEIKDAIPLNPGMMAYLPSDVLLLLLSADQSKAFANSYETARRIYHYTPSVLKRAYVVPSQCVQQRLAGLSYACPPNLSATSHGTTMHRYFSSHALFGTGDDALKESAVVLQSTACIQQALTGVVQPYCSGSQATFSGTWRETGSTPKAATPKYTWTLPAP